MDIQERRRRRNEMLASGVQAWAAVLTLLVGVPGLWLAYSALREQQEVNREQQAINREQQAIVREEQARERQRYAVRVAYWDEVRDGGIMVHVQNRAPVPMHEVTIGGEVVAGDRDRRFATYRFDALLDTLPPCTLLDIQVREQDIGRVKPELTTIEQAWRTFDLEFADPVGRWSVGTGPDGRFRVAQAQVDTSGTGVPRGVGQGFTTFPAVTLTGPGPAAEATLVTRTGPLSDCGESG